MTYDDDRISEEDSRIREGVRIDLPAKAWYISTSKSSVLINGNLYSPLPAEIGEVTVPTNTDDGNLEITLPVIHPSIVRWLANLCPPKMIRVTVYRYEKRSGEWRTRWLGFMTSLSYQSDGGDLCKILVPSRMTASLAKRLPTMSGGPSCPHVLFDENCKVDKNAFKVTATVTLVAGGQLTLSSISGKPDRWARLGKIIHPASGEWMPVVDQVGTLVTMQYPIFEINHGDTVELYAGCDHTVTGTTVGSIVTVGCFGFANVKNFGGQPILKLSRAYHTGSRGSTSINDPHRHMN